MISPYDYDDERLDDGSTRFIAFILLTVYGLCMAAALGVLGWFLLDAVLGLAAR